MTATTVKTLQNHCDTIDGLLAFYQAELNAGRTLAPKDRAAYERLTMQKLELTQDIVVVKYRQAHKRKHRLLKKYYKR